MEVTLEAWILSCFHFFDICLLSAYNFFLELFKRPSAFLRKGKLKPDA